MGHPHRVQTATQVNLLHRQLLLVHNVWQGRTTVMMTLPQRAQLVPLGSTHLGIRMEQMVAPSVLQDTPITTAIHQRHV
jgi:hypothetical protein